MDSRDLKELLICVEALGTKDGNRYVLGKDCVVALQDLQRWLRRDDENRIVHLQLGKWQLVANHLVPILVGTRFGVDTEVLFECCRLLCTLSLPPHVQSVNHEAQFAILRQIKLAFVSNQESVRKIVAILAQVLELRGKDRRKRDVELMDLLVNLLINLLSIPDAERSTSAVTSLSSLQDDLIVVLEDQKALRLFVALSQSISEPDNQKYGPFLLEIVYCLFNKHDPFELAKIAFNAAPETAPGEIPTPGTPTSASAKVAVLLKALDAVVNNVSAPAASMSVRHPRFGGSFLRTSETGYDTVHYGSIQKLMMPQITVRPPAARGKKPPADKQSVGGVTAKVVLANYAQQVLAFAFNELMTEFDDRLLSGENFDERDIVRYLRVMGFMSAFHGQLYRERMAAWKKDRSSGSRPLLELCYFSSVFKESSFLFVADRIEAYEKDPAKLLVAVTALRDLLSSLHAMFESNETENTMNADVILNKIVYQPDLFLDRLVQVIKWYKPASKPKSYLENAIECVHVLMEILDRSPQRIVQLKRRSGRSTGAATAVADEKEDYKEPDLTEHQDLDLKEAAKTDSEPNVDAEEEIRDAREAQAEREKYFSVDGYITSFARQNVLRNYLSLLREYKRNTPKVNKMVVKMLQRFATVGQAKGMFCQVSTLRVLNAILSDATLEKHPDFAELREFCKEMIQFIVQAFTAKPASFVILALFPKSRLEAQDAFSTIRREGDIDYDPEIDSDQEDALLEEEYARREREIDEDLEQLAKARNEQTPRASERREFRPDLSKLRKAGRASSAAWPSVSAPPRSWTPEEDSELKDNFDRYKNRSLEDLGVMDQVSSMLSFAASPEQCYARLVELGASGIDDISAPEPTQEGRDDSEDRDVLDELLDDSPAPEPASAADLVESIRQERRKRSVTFEDEEDKLQQAIKLKRMREKAVEEKKKKSEPKRKKTRRGGDNDRFVVSDEEEPEKADSDKEEEEAQMISDEDEEELKRPKERKKKKKPKRAEEEGAHSPKKHRIKRSAPQSSAIDDLEACLEENDEVFTPMVQSSSNDNVTYNADEDEIQLEVPKERKKRTIGELDLDLGLDLEEPDPNPPKRRKLRRAKASEVDS